MGIKQKLEKWKNFMMFTSALAVFFILPQFHDWANNFKIKLHFCNHAYCILFAIIFIVMAYRAYDKKKSYLKTALIILIVGIILMNMAVCVDGKMSILGFGLSSFGNFAISDDSGCKPGIDCPGDIVEVPIPPCLETDAGRDYITFGTIMSGANIDDLCMGDILRERYCNSELTYTSEDINCKTRYGADWTCEEGECREGEALPTETDCGDGIDNDLDGDIDCADSDCDYSWFEGGCGDFDYSCEHNPTNPYPFCGGTCPSGEVCADYAIESGSWCECIPIGETSCVDSTGEGWCEEGYNCVEISGEYYCEYDFGTCYDTDGGNEPLVGGFCVATYPEIGTLNIIEYCGWEKGDEDTLYEYYCFNGGDMSIEYDCVADFGLCCIENTVYGSYCGECEY